MKKKIAVLLSPWAVDYVVEAIKGMQKACQNNNTDLYIFASYKFSESEGVANTTGFAIYNLIDYSKYDGVIIVPSFFNDDQIVEKERKRIIASGLPAVSLNTELEGLSFIYSESRKPHKELIRHLITEHHLKKFAYIGGPIENQGALASLNVFKEVLAEEKITISDDDIYMQGDWSYNYGYSTGNAIFEKENIPEAIVCINDQAAMGAITAAAEHNLLVPDDVKIIGFEQTDYSSKVIPSITTMNTCVEKMGEDAVKLILSKTKKVVRNLVMAVPCYGQSCGCKKEITSEQIKFSQNFQKEAEKDQRFASQLRHLEASFIKNENVYDLTKNLQVYFKKRHSVEGEDFAILINNEVIESLKEKLITSKESKSFNKKLMVITNLKKGEPEKVQYLVPSSQLIPECMESDKSSLYLFLPIFNQNYLHGYYVSKDYYGMLLNKCAYNWTRNFGTIIEKFRTTSIYRIMGEQFRILSTKDPLSGLLNRAGMDSYAAKLFEDNCRANKSTLIIFVDINSMKIINDKFGHLHGDLAVKTVSESITAAISKKDFAIRYGGDEFVIVKTCRKPEIAEECMKKIREQLVIKEEQMSLPYHLSISCGAKIFKPKEKPNLSEAIKVVDDLMYKEKIAYHKKLKKSD